MRMKLAKLETIEMFFSSNFWDNKMCSFFCSVYVLQNTNYVFLICVSDCLSAVVTAQEYISN